MPFLTQIPTRAENLRYGRSGSVTVGVGGSAFVTGDVSTGTGGGGGVATVEVGSGEVDTGSALAVEVASVTVCVTCVTALFAVVVTACVAEVALGSEATVPGVSATPVAPASG